MAIKSEISFRERTHEFLAISEKMNKIFPPKPTGSSSIETKLDGFQSPATIQSEFNKKASNIGHGIHQTSMKVSKLAILAKKTGSYDDPIMEIQDLTAVIKQEITALNSAIVNLQLLLGSQNDGGKITDDTTTHASTVVDNLKNRLMAATKDFKEVLTLRTERLKGRDSRNQMFSSKDPSTAFIRQRPLASRPSWRQETELPSTSSSSSSSSSHPLMPRHRQQQQQLTLPGLQDSYSQSRYQGLHGVESTIQELGNIFTQLATMVSQQGELAIRIDENVDETLVNVEGAQGALLKHLTKISSNRFLMIKIFFVLIVFLLIFLFFFS